MAKLTTKFLESVKPAPARREIPDAGCRGLYLVVQPTGRKAWVVRYRYRGDTRKLTLDPGLSLAEARKAATAALHELERGNVRRCSSSTPRPRRTRPPPIAPATPSTRSHISLSSSMR